MRQEIKLEPISETSSISTNSKKSDTKENDLNSINIKREKISVGARSQIDSSRDSSILVIPNEVNIITLSDDDDEDIDDKKDDNKMPPPSMPAPKKLPTKKTRNNQKNSEEPSSSEVDSSQHTDTSSSQLQPKKTRKVKKPKKPVLPIVEIKQEKDTDNVELSNQKTSSNKSSEKVIPDTASKNVTLESVYEDASDKIPSVSL